MKNTLSKSNLRLNFIFNIISQAVTVLSPLIITPKLSRVFGPDYLGIKGFTYSIVFYFAVFGLLGLDMYGQRKIAIEKDDVYKRSRTFWTVFTSRFCLLLISTVFYLLYVIFFGGDSFQKLVFFCWTVYLIREMLNPTWFLQGIEKYNIISVLSIISHVVYVTLTFVFIKSKNLLPLYVLFYTVVPLIISVYTFCLVFKFVKPVKITVKEMSASVKESLVYFVPTIATAVYSMIDKTMLGFFDDSKISTGFYESAEKLVKVALAVTTSSFTIMRTRMSYVFGKNDNKLYSDYSSKFISFSMMLCWPIMFGIIGISKDFVPLFFGAGFEPVITLSYVFSLVIPCLTVSGLLQAIFIFPYGLQKTMDIYYVCIVTVNIILNFVLINFFGTFGAIAASITAELMLAVILLIKARKDIEIKLLFIYSIKYLIAGALMLAAILLLSNIMHFGAVVKLIIEIAAGVVIYFAVCFALRDKFVIEQSKNVLGKVFKKKN